MMVWLNHPTLPPYIATYSLTYSANGQPFSRNVFTVSCSGGVATATVVNTTLGLGGAPGGWQPLDDRLDPDAIAGPVALYCDGRTLNVYDDTTGPGFLLFSFSDWPSSVPAVNTLLKQVGEVSLWQLTTGEFQINAPAGEGKTYVFIFNGCPYDGQGYNASIDPGEQ